MYRLLSRFSFFTATLATVASVASAQSGATISGRVTNEQGAPLPGANVFLIGLNIGSQTNDAGRYTFVVTGTRAAGQTATLTARVIGYSAKSVPVTLTAGSTINQDFSLTVNALRLGEVVVTGAGTSTTRERIASTINSVDSSAIRRASTPQNVVSALSGLAPNVEVRTQSGEPGASASIKIRGASSLSGTNQPLFVVDGQPIDNSTMSTMGGDGGTVTQNRAADINPNDIESIDILKGGAAAAIYGARASNGVVLITTKRGRSGPTRYTFGSTNTFDSVNPNIALQTQYGQGSGGVFNRPTAPDKTATNLSWGPLLTGAPAYDHESEIYHTGITSDNNLQVSGGSDRTTFFASGGVTAQDGVLAGGNNKYNRTAVRLKGTQAVSSQLNLGGNFAFFDTRGRYVQQGSNTSGLLLGALRTPPDFNNLPFLSSTSGLQRSYRFPNPSPASTTTGRGYDNPFFTLANPANRSELGRATSNINANYNPFGWLSVLYTLGGDYYNDSRVVGLPLTSSSEPDGADTRYTINNLEIDHNLTATAKHTFSDNVEGNIVVGQNLNSRRNRQIFVTGITLKDPNLFAIQNLVSTTPQETKSLAHIESYFTQAELDLYNQLYLTVGVRNDGFSTFGSSDRRHNFPKASAAWTFTNFLGNADHKGLLSFGKLRFSYGETGKEPPLYGAITALSYGIGTFGSGFGDANNATINGQPGLITGGQAGNAALRPEVSREREFGTDLGFFDQRADLGITVYNKTSTDVIVPVPVSAASTGTITAVENAGSISNKGVEVTLNLRPITTANVAWDIGVQFGRNRGKVLNLAGADFIPYNNEGFTGAIGSSTVGYAPGVIRGSDFIRCGRGLMLDIGQGGISNIDALCGPNAKAGALYLAANGKPVTDPTDRVIADPNPKYTMSYNTSIKLLNRLTLSGLLDLRKGGQVWDGTRSGLYRFGTAAATTIRSTTDGQFGKNFYTDIYPTVAGPGAGVVAFKTYADWQNWFTTAGGSAGDTQQQFVEDGSFVKLRELALTYSIDQSFFRNHFFGFSSADLRFAGRNLHTWTKYKGLDPEASLGGAEFLTQGIDFFNNPQTRSFVVSVSLNR